MGVSIGPLFLDGAVNCQTLSLCLSLSLFFQKHSGTGRGGRRKEERTHGAIQLTRMFFGPASWAAQRVRPMTACCFVMSVEQFLLHLEWREEALILFTLLVEYAAPPG